MKNVLIASLWGRGSALAYRLKKQNYSVTFVDMSPCLSLCSSETEGPFGVFVPEGLNGLDKTVLCGDSCFPVEQGFSCFTSSGPMESCGNFKFLPKKKQKVLWNLVQEWTNSYLSFQDTEGDLYKEKYFFRENSQAYFSELREFLQKAGVKWVSVDSTQQVDIFIESKHAYMEIEGVKEKSFLVWALGGLESRELFPKFFNLLFPDWSEPIYIWQRFSLKWNPREFQKIYPAVLAVLPDKEQLKEGVMSIKKHPFSSHTDLWILCSYQQSADKAYLSNLISSAERQIQSLFPFSSITVSFDDKKQCQNYFVLYQEVLMREKLSFKKTLPVLHLNPESCGKLDSYSLMKHSLQMFRFLRTQMEK